MSEWIWQLLLWTGKASGVILCVLALQFCLGKRLSANWRFALWSVVLVRLALPILPQSPLSLFHLVKVDRFADRIPGLNELGATAVPATTVGLPIDLSTQGITWPAGLAALWMLGALLLVSRRFLGWRSLRRSIKESSVIQDGSILQLVDSYRLRSDLPAPIELRLTQEQLGPAVVGLLRPKILIPASLLSTLTQDELGHILQHELEHIRRRDLWIRALANFLAIVHWFNPLVHVAFKQMEADCELACDSSVLRRLERQDRTAYGHTLISLSSTERFASGVLGMGGTARKQLKRRIQMISRFKASSPQQQLAGLGTLAVLIAVSLTDVPALAKAESLLTPQEQKEAVKETIVKSRNVGTAMMSYLTDACSRGLCEPNENEELKDPLDKKIADWNRCPVISHAELEAKLVPKYLPTLPTEDGWGNPLQYCLQRDEGLGKSRGVLGIRSPGSDKKYTGSQYLGGPFSVEEHHHDVVWMDGYFVTWPGATK